MSPASSRGSTNFWVRKDMAVMTAPTPLRLSPYEVIADNAALIFDTRNRFSPAYNVTKL